MSHLAARARSRLVAALALVAVLFTACPGFPGQAPGAGGAPGEPPHPADLADLVARRDWPLVAAFVIWGIVRLLQKDTRLPDVLNIPRDLRPLAPIILGALSGVLEHLIAGVAWRDAMTGAVVAAVGSMTFQDAFVHVALGVLSRLLGRDVKLLPALLAARPTPTTPATPQEPSNPEVAVTIDAANDNETNVPAAPGQKEETRP